MKAHTFPLCGSRMKRNGKTGAGRTRWRCVSCESSSVRRNDGTVRLLEAFLSWLLTRREVG